MQSGKPLLSVLVPAFNAEKFIGVCIRSLLVQTYTPIEILICDDGSSDNTWQVINRFSDSRIKAFRNSRNIGKNQTSIFLFEQAMGEYISIHDADDISSCSRFQEQMSFLMSDPDYAMCGTNFVRFLNNGKIVGRSNLAIKYEVIRESIKSESQFHGPTIVFKREIIPQVGGLYRYFTCAEDIDLTMRITEKFKVANLPGHLYFYRHEALSLTNNIRGYNTDRFAHFRLLYYLAEERYANGGLDSLMLGDKQKVDEKVSEFKNEFERDPEIVLRKGVFRLLHVYMYKNALLLAWIAVSRNCSAANMKCLCYTVLQFVKGNFQLLRARQKIDLSFLTSES